MVNSLQSFLRRTYYVSLLIKRSGLFFIVIISISTDPLNKYYIYNYLIEIFFTLSYITFFINLFLTL